MKEFRTLTAREIDCRVGTQTESGISLLLYKDARVDMNILDEVFGPEKWQRKHDVVNGNLFCTVSIKFGDEWVSKQDVGTESKTEAEKGEASDSFKRACVNWGIGRELYTAPFIWVKAESFEKDSKGRVKDRFEVKSIGYDSHKEINEISIINTRTKKTVFSFGKSSAKNETNEPTKAEEPALKSDITDLAKFPEVEVKGATCERCLKPIEPTVDKEGSPVTVGRLMEISQKRFKGNYCAACQKLIYESQKKAKANGGN